LPVFTPAEQWLEALYEQQLIARLVRETVTRPDQGALR